MGIGDLEDRYSGYQSPIDSPVGLSRDWIVRWLEDQPVRMIEID
jgi:hypothetical protein